MPNGQQNFIIVVSGLPRSGTSMRMRMLESGGIPILMAGRREAGDDNPLGYFEFEPVKRLGKDTSWLEEAYSKAAKIIYIFLYSLPPSHKYGDGPKARRRRKTARNSHDSGPGGANRGQVGDRADLRGGPGTECLWLPAEAECAGRHPESASVSPKF